MEVNMNKTDRRTALKFSLSLLMMVSIAFVLAACKSNEPAGTATAEKAGTPGETINLATVSDILGKGHDEYSGVFDLAKGDTEYWIVYHFYTPEAKDIDDDIGVDLAPKIQSLYKKFKTIDRIQFTIHAFHAGSSLEWKPYCSFILTRKIINETNWTNLLATEFFKVVQDLHYAE
jgi:hypothetical protein